MLRLKPLLFEVMHSDMLGSRTHTHTHLNIHLDYLNLRLSERAFYFNFYFYLVVEKCQEVENQVKFRNISKSVY